MLPDNMTHVNKKFSITLILFLMSVIFLKKIKHCIIYVVCILYNQEILPLALIPLLL